MEIHIYEKSVIDDSAKGELAEIGKIVEKLINLANKTSEPQRALTTFLEMLNINGIVKELPFDFSEENKIVKVRMDFACKKTNRTNLANLLKIRRRTDNCYHEELTKIVASVRRMVTLAYSTKRPSSVLLSFIGHLEEIEMVLPLIYHRHLNMK